MNRIEYRLTENDLLKFNLYYSANSELHQKQRRRHRVIVPVAYAVLAALLCLSRSFAAASLFAVFAVAWFLLSPKWMLKRYRKHYEKHIRETVGESLRTPMTMELRADGICSTSHLGESKYRYSAVDKLVENDGYTYVFIGKGMALVLPHDRIPQDTIRSVVSEITQRKQEANTHPLKPTDGRQVTPLSPAHARNSMLALHIPMYDTVVDHTTPRRTPWLNYRMRL